MAGARKFKIFLGGTEIPPDHFMSFSIDCDMYQPDLAALEPALRGKGKTQILIRGMNKLHLLLRKRKSVTFTDKTDQAILNQVVGDCGLTLDWQHDKSITYKHVYQHNQTDLEFLRQRAARMG